MRDRNLGAVCDDYLARCMTQGRCEDYTRNCLDPVAERKWDRCTRGAVRCVATGKGCKSLARACLSEPRGDDCQAAIERCVSSGQGCDRVGPICEEQDACLEAVVPDPQHIALDGDGIVFTRAEASDPKRRRIYRVHYEVADASANAVAAVCTIEFDKERVAVCAE